MRQLFGTDGIRGVAGEYPLDQRTVYAIGRALGQRLAARDHAGPGGDRAGYARVQRLDQLRPGGRPGIGTGRGGERGSHHHAGRGISDACDGFSAGIVISASHNPWQDNGIKIFGADGYKLSDEIEHADRSGYFRASRTAGRRCFPQCGINVGDAAGPCRIAASSMQNGWRSSLAGPISASCECWWIAPTEQPATSRRWYSDIVGYWPISCTLSRTAEISMPDAARCIPQHIAQAVAAAQWILRCGSNVRRRR